MNFQPISQKEEQEKQLCFVLLYPLIEYYSLHKKSQVISELVIQAY